MTTLHKIRNLVRRWENEEITDVDLACDIAALIPSKQDKPVDVGENAACGECGQQLCYCPERQRDGSWKYKSLPKEIKLPVNSKRVKTIEKIYMPSFEYGAECSDFWVWLGSFVREHNKLISHITALEERE